MTTFKHIEDNLLSYVRFENGTYIYKPEVVVIINNEAKHRALNSCLANLKDKELIFKTQMWDRLKEHFEHNVTSEFVAALQKKQISVWQADLDSGLIASKVK